MTEYSKTPSFNIKVVLRETGLKADALRVWEKRYGLPDPARTEGGHRLYSQYDIEMIKWLLARKADGLSISKAVKLFRELEADGKNPLVPSSPAHPIDIAPGEQLDAFRQDWIAACKAFNELEAEKILSQAFALYPPETVGVELLQKGLREIGEGWFSNEITIAQEHFASNLAIRKLDAIISAAPPPTRREKVLIACASKEMHIFSALLITLMLRNRGWEVIYLGADVPIGELEKVVASSKPDAAVLIAMQLNTAAHLMEMATLLLKHNVAVGYGGLAFQRFEQLRDLIPGRYLGQELKDSVNVIAELVNGSVDPEPTRANPLQELHDAYIANASLIEAEVTGAFLSDPVAVEFIRTGNEQLREDILAASKFGDLNLLDGELEWVRDLLASRQLPIDVLREYLSIYQGAVETQMGSSGAALADWLSRSAARF